MGNLRKFGQQDGYLFVNSASGQGRVWVNTHVPESNFQGAVPLAVVEAQLPGGQLRIADTIIGSVALRMAVQDRLHVTKRQANNILDSFRIEKRWHGQPVVACSSLDAFLDSYQQAKSRNMVRKAT